MAYTALYRNYRPNSFSEVAGQKHIIKTLKSAVINNKTSHAYIFSGQRGIGKTTIARILAKAVNCLNLQNGEPCNECEHCKAIMNNETPDIVELDAASNNGVDEMRSLLEKVNYLPSTLSKKVYIIDEVHMLSISAFNALLKTLEEPPVHVMFVLATTEPHKIPLTILSRCQRFDFRQLSNLEIVERLNFISKKENIDISQGALYAVAEAAEGGMRDAVNILDQVSAYSEGKVEIEDVDGVTGRVSNYKLIELINCFINKDANLALQKIDELIDMGKEVSRLTGDLVQFCRDILLYKNAVDVLEYKNMHNIPEFVKLCDEISVSDLFYYIDVLMDAHNKLRYSSSNKIYLEVSIMKIISGYVGESNIVEKINELESKIGTGTAGSANLSVDAELKISELDLRIKKIIEELGKINITEFKLDTFNKISMLEESVSSGLILPKELNEKVNQLENLISGLSLTIQTKTNEVDNSLVERIIALEAKDNSDIYNRLELLENKEPVMVTDSDLLERVTALENKKPEIMTIPTNSVDNAKLSVIEENVEQLMNYIVEFESQYNKNVMVENSESSVECLKELTELKENYFVLVQKVSELMPSEEEQTDKCSEIKEYLVVKEEEINTKIKEITDKLGIYDTKFELVDNNVLDISTKLDEIKENNFEQQIQDVKTYVDDLKEYNLKLSVKFNDLQNTLTKVEPKEENKPIVIEKPVVIKEEVVEIPVNKTEEPTVEQQSVEEVVETVKEKEPTVEVQEVNETTKVFDVKIIENILHESRRDEMRQEKANLVSSWNKLASGTNNTTAPIAKLLRDGTLIANGESKLLIVYSLASYCNRLMSPKVHKEAVDILKITFGKDYDFIAIPENTWQEKRKEYYSQYGMGIKYPKLSPINNPELKVVVLKETTAKEGVFEKAASLFGYKNVRRED